MNWDPSPETRSKYVHVHLDTASMRHTVSGNGVSVGQFRTALVLKHPEVIRLAKSHQSLAKKHGFEVALFTNLEDGFAWLACENPEPDVIKL